MFSLCVVKIICRCFWLAFSVRTSSNRFKAWVCKVRSSSSIRIREYLGAENTINAYLYAIKEYYSRHRELNKRNLLIYKTYLIETFKPKTVNLRIQAMNKYLECIKKPRLRLKSVKVQQRSYLENVISNADYIFLKNKLKRENNLTYPLVELK